MESSSNFLLVAAIDFGTTYSGYAFSTRAEFKRDPLCISTNQTWNAGTRRLCSLKTPTCLLLGPNKEFIAFGYEAEDKFAELVMDEKHRNYFYFERFKMKLHNQPNLNIDTTLEDKTGKALPALDVFALSIKALKDHLMNQIQTQGVDIRPNEIQWVLTVPAIWTDKAKQFMRKSAEKAGISSAQLLIALEPEAASIYYQHQNKQNLETAASMGSGTRYMIVDLGGGTADLTVHEKMDEGSLKEICRATGGSCGGETVNDAYIDMIEEIVNIPSLRHKLLEEYLEDFLDVIRDFEVAKRTIKPDATDKITINIPYNTLDALCKQHHGKSLAKMLSSSSYSETISFRGTKMRCSIDVIINLFCAAIAKIIQLIANSLEGFDAQEVRHIVMVGGFSECSLIRNEVQKSFPNIIVFAPKDCGLAVLQGAVLFGHQPNSIAVRVMKYTYGISTYTCFDELLHDRAHYVVQDGIEMCKDTFFTLIEKDRQVKVGETTEHTFSSQKNCSFNAIELFCTKRENPMYTDEEGCILVGKLRVAIPEPRNISHELIVSMTFGKTELFLEAEEGKSGKKYRTTLTML